MLSILQLEKEQIYKLMQKIIINTSYWKFRLQEAMVRENEEKSSLLHQQLCKEFGSRQGRQLKKMGLITSTGIEALEQALSYSHWAILENLKVEKCDNKTLRFGVIGCSTKQTMDKWGLKLNCNSGGWITRKSFIEAIEPGARVYPLFTALDNDKQGTAYTCLWEVKLV